MSTPRKRASRARKPAWQFTGMSLAEWQATPNLVQWAQQSAEFKLFYTMLINERRQALGRNGSEPRQLGLAEGYELALTVAERAAQGAHVEPATEPEAYEHARDPAPETDQFVP